MVLCLLCIALAEAQPVNNGLDTAAVQQYVEVCLNVTQLDAVSRAFSVDRVRRHDALSFDVRICLAKPEYASFLALGYPYTVVPPTKANVQMATTYNQMTAQWNCYPTYSTYTAMLDTFRTRYPNLCDIDTILESTPGNHSLFVAHISSSLDDKGDRPSFFYSSTIHGDEPVGYYLMLRLIDYLLTNYESNDAVRRLVDSVDIWICPLENPDGTYFSSNNQLNEYPYSIRYNRHYADLNRSYPEFGASASGNHEPEVQAMMDFGAEKHFVMSANFHGGAEIFNYPWDTWTTQQRPNTDRFWWSLVGHSFADTCQSYHSSYMTDETDGVTEGGDWYVITGSRQDYFNYFLHCREATIEVGADKVISSSRLPNYWNWIRASLLHYIGESLYGIRGTVTDSITGLPLEARVFIQNIDEDNSHVFSHLPAGDYHRPIKEGTYPVTFSADGYQSKTILISVNDRKVVWQDVALLPIGYPVEAHPASSVRMVPNPTTDYVTITRDAFLNKEQIVELFDMTGRKLQTRLMHDDEVRIDLSGYAQGIYLVRVSESGRNIFQEKLIKLRN